MVFHELQASVPVTVPPRPCTSTGVPSGTAAEVQPSVSVSSPVPPQCAAWPRKVRSPAVNTNPAVHRPAPVVSVTVPGPIDPGPATTAGRDASGPASARAVVAGGAVTTGGAGAAAAGGAVTGTATAAPPAR